MKVSKRIKSLLATLGLLAALLGLGLVPSPQAAASAHTFTTVE